MAANGVIIKLVCAICQQQMFGRSPRTLQCNHSFCCECLKKYSEGRNILDQVTCPTCDSAAGINKREIENLPVNSTLSKIRKFRRCARCSSDRFAGYCLDCHSVFCDKCTEKHEGEDHVILDTCSAEKCVVHSKILSKVCTKCDKYFCNLCSHDVHRQHTVEIEMVVALASEKEEEAMAVLMRLDKRRNEVQEAISKLDYSIQNLDEHSWNIRQKVENETNHMRTILLEKRKQLITILTGIEECGFQIEEVKHKLSDMQSKQTIIPFCGLFLPQYKGQCLLEAAQEFIQTDIRVIEFKSNLDHVPIGSLISTLVK